MNLKRTIRKLTLYENDLYEGKIVIVPHTGNLYINKCDDTIIQTDATCWCMDNQTILFRNYNYVLLRKFKGHINVQNELYYDIDDLEDKGIDFNDLFPIYPNRRTLNYYMDYCDMSLKTKYKCLNYAKILNKDFYK